MQGLEARDEEAQHLQCRRPPRFLAAAAAAAPAEEEAGQHAVHLFGGQAAAVGFPLRLEVAVRLAVVYLQCGLCDRTKGKRLSIWVMNVL